MVRATVLVLGLGNILLGDEGFGVYVVRALRDSGIPEGVELMEGAVGGIGLLEALTGAPRTIIVDAADMGLPPGSIRRFTPEQLAPSHEAPLSLHQMGLSDVLDLARALGHTPDVVIIGVQPASLEPHLGLSVALEAAKDRAVGMVLQELAPCLKAEA